MGKVTWKFLTEFFKARGLKPDEAFQMLKENFLDRNYSEYDGYIWRDIENRKTFKKLVGYVYSYMEYSQTKWKKALEDLVKKDDETIKMYLVDMLVPGSVVGGKIKWSPSTFAKRVSQWRQYFFDQGWLDYDMRPEIIRSRKALERKGVIKKATAATANRRVGRALGKAIRSNLFSKAISQKKKS